MAQERFAADPDRARELMGDAKTQAQQAIRELRDLARAIAPPILTSHGLAAAVDSLATTSPLHVAPAELTPRELEVLGLIAEGRSNAGIADALVVTPGAVEKHISRIFDKLELPAAGADHRRVLADLRER